MRALLQVCERLARLVERERAVNHRLQPRAVDDAEQFLKSGAVTHGNVAERGAGGFEAEEVDAGVGF